MILVPKRGQLLICQDKSLIICSYQKNDIALCFCFVQYHVSSSNFILTQAERGTAGWTKKASLEVD